MKQAHRQRRMFEIAGEPFGLLDLALAVVSGVALVVVGYIVTVFAILAWGP